MKKTKVILISACLSIFTATTSLAGAWQAQTSGQWKYQNDDGNYAFGWINDNGKSYYLDVNGIMLFNTITPDGYTVGPDGAWDGQPARALTTQTQVTVTPTETTATTVSAPNGISSSPYDGYTIVVNTNSKKYHNPSCSSVSDISQGNLGYCSDTTYLSSQGYVPCKRCH